MLSVHPAATKDGPMENARPRRPVALDCYPLLSNGRGWPDKFWLTRSSIILFSGTTSKPSGNILDPMQGCQRSVVGNHWPGPEPGWGAFHSGVALFRQKTRWEAGTRKLCRKPRLGATAGLPRRVAPQCGFPRKGHSWARQAGPLKCQTICFLPRRTRTLPVRATGTSEPPGRIRPGFRPGPAVAHGYRTRPVAPDPTKYLRPFHRH